MSHSNNTPDPAKTISPKVIAQAGVAVVGAGILAAGAALTPDLFSDLGPWGIVVYAGIVGALGAAAGYIVKDPLRG